MVKLHATFENKASNRASGSNKRSTGQSDGRSANNTADLAGGISDVDAGRANVGEDIRALRKSRNVTLADMANSLNRSIGWLSQVERGQTEPGIPDLRRIAQIFEIPTSFFFRNEMAESDELGFVVRANSRASLGSRKEGLVEELLSPNLSGEFEMIRSAFEPHSKSEWVEARPTHEGGYLISGQLTLHVKSHEGDKRFDLLAGDSFQFQNETYAWENSSDEPAIAIWVISPPIY